jgi:hypothetical protein
MPDKERYTMQEIGRRERGQRSEGILLKNPYECFDELSMNGKIFNGFNSSSVRPEALEG